LFLECRNRGVLLGLYREGSVGRMVRTAECCWYATDIGRVVGMVLKEDSFLDSTDREEFVGWF
jgi:hypothetical protein